MSVTMMVVMVTTNYCNDNDDNDNICDDHDDGACMEDVAMHGENQEPLEESVDANQEVGGSDLTPQRDKGGFFILFMYNCEG